MTFSDNVNDQRLVTELNEARCFCCLAWSPNRGIEMVSLSRLEAMAMETPPVPTAVSRIPELFENEISGLLTEPRDSNATANALVSLSEGDSERTRYARRAREKVTADFNIEREANKLESTFRKAQARSE